MMFSPLLMSYEYEKMGSAPNVEVRVANHDNYGLICIDLVE